MTILNQDRDEIFTLTDKGLLKSNIYIKVAYFQGQLMGYNIIGKRLFKEKILGTYDESEAQQIIQEIYKLMRYGVSYYSMPNPTLDLEELGVNL